MNAPPPLTIGLPFLDEEASLALAVRSILRQTMPDFELLLVDDGSRDRSVEIAHSFDDPRVVVVSDGQRRGLATRLNEITRRARSELVARMDGDDASHPTRIARELELLETSRADAVGTWAGLFDETGTPFAVIETKLPNVRRAASALEHGMLVHPSMVARRAWLLANPYDETLFFAEDRDLWVRTANESTFAVVPEPLHALGVSIDGGFVRGYGEAQRLNRLLYLRHGPRTLGLARTARLWLGSHAKTAIMRAAARAGQARRLVRRRGRPPTDGERGQILEALASGQRP